MSLKNLFSKLTGTTPSEQEDRDKAFDYVANFANNKTIADLTRRYRLSIIHTTNASVPLDAADPCTKDVSIYVFRYKSTSGAHIPMLRKDSPPDFSRDRNISDFSALVGNEKGKKLTKISMEDYLKNIGNYIGNIDQNGIFEPRDNTVQVNMQYGILPCKKSVEFVPQLFNYHANPENPATLAITVSKDGTSTEIVTKEKQRLYFNSNGRAKPFTLTNNGDKDTDDTIYIYQVPLKYETRRELEKALESLDIEEDTKSKKRPEKSSLISNPIKTVYTGVKKPDGDHMELRRDPRYPIRLTIIKCLLTTKEISEDMIGTISSDFDKMFRKYSAYGSLITEEDIKRITAAKVKPLISSA
jgi:hypothetical protein